MVYSSDTRYMDKVMEKKLQHAKLCQLLAAEGYGLMLLPIDWDDIVLGSAGLQILKALIVQQNSWTLIYNIPNARTKNLHRKLHLTRG
jgi:hypothetical protein